MGDSDNLIPLLIEWAEAGGHWLELDAGRLRVFDPPPEVIDRLQPHAQQIERHLKRAEADAASMIAKAQRAAQRSQRKAA